jgi:hypothetical protein
MVAVIMPPGPVLLLFLGAESAKIAVGVAVVFSGPTVVVNDLIVIPHVVIGVVGIVNAVVMLRAADTCQ